MEKRRLAEILFLQEVNGYEETAKVAEILLLRGSLTVSFFEIKKIEQALNHKRTTKKHKKPSKNLKLSNNLRVTKFQLEEDPWW